VKNEWWKKFVSVDKLFVYFKHKDTPDF